MAKLVVSIHKRASNRISAQAQWYHEHRGDSFTRTMLRNITEDINALCEMPTIGKVLCGGGKHQYRVFVSKKKWKKNQQLCTTHTKKK